MHACARARAHGSEITREHACMLKCVGRLGDVKSTPRAAAERCIQDNKVSLSFVTMHLDSMLELNPFEA